MGEATSGGALTVVNAIPTGTGAAIGLELSTSARVELVREEGPVDLEASQAPDIDPSLARACLDVLSHELEVPLSGRIETDSQIPIARGLKSSSAAANAIVMAILDALELEAASERVLDLSVRAARQAGVTATGALDDAAASLLGGLVVTDNAQDRILRRKRLGASLPVLLLVPEREQPTQHVDPLDQATPVCEQALALLEQDEWKPALTLNGLGIAATLGTGLDPAYRALAAGALAAGVSGTGPAVGAVCTEETTASIRGAWQPYTSGILTTRTRDREASS